MTMVCGLAFVGLQPNRHASIAPTRGVRGGLSLMRRFGCVFGYANIELITAFYIPFSL